MDNTREIYLRFYFLNETIYVDLSFTNTESDGLTTSYNQLIITCTWPIRFCICKTQIYVDGLINQMCLGNKNMDFYSSVP